MIRRLFFFAHNNADEQAKCQLVPIVRGLIEAVVIGKTLGHQPAALQVHIDLATDPRCLSGRNRGYAALVAGFRPD